MIEIAINQGLVITLIVAMWMLRGILSIIAGALKLDKSSEYGTGDIVGGFIMIILTIIVLMM